MTSDEYTLRTLRVMRAQVIALLEQLDSFAAQLESPAPSPDLTVPNCSEGRHPADFVISAPVMGSPNRKLCRACGHTFMTEEKKNAESPIQEH